METANLTESQLDALCDAEERDAKFKALTLDEKVAALREQGHPAFDEAAPVDVGPLPGAIVPAGATVTTTAIAERDEPEETALAMAGGGMGGDALDGLGSDAFVLGALRLSQSTSRDEGAQVPDGLWWLLDEPEGATEKRDIAILHVAETRSLMLPFKKDQRPAVIDDILRMTNVVVPADHEGPVCRSNDRVRPVPSEIGALSSSCAECPAAKWQGKVKPLCGEAYRLIVVDITPDPDSGEPVMAPAVLYLRSAQIKTAKKMFTALKLRAARRKAPQYSFRVRLGSNRVQTDDGVFYAVTFERPERIDDEGILEELGAWREVIAAGRARERDGGEAE